MYLLTPDHRLTGLHGTTGNKDRWNIQAHGRIKHSRGNLVAVGDTHQSIGTVGIDHVLDTIGNNFTGWQRIQHTTMPHGDTVIHGDSIEFLGNTAGLFHLPCHQLAHVFQVYMTRDKLGKGIGDSDNRLVKILVLHTGGTPQ